MEQKKEPLCHLFEDLREPGLIEKLGLDRETFEPAFWRLRSYWVLVLPPELGQEYVMCAALQLREVLQTPREWEEIGFYLADATARTYGNGSHQFIGEAVPALIDSGLAKTKEELVHGIDILLGTINFRSSQTGRFVYDGGKVFSQVAACLRNGEITSVDDIRKRYPPFEQ